MLRTLVALLLLQTIIGFHCAKTNNPYLITQATGTAHISVRVPGPFEGIYLDDTTYIKEGDECKSDIPGSEQIPCSLTTDGDVFTAKAEISNVQDHRVLAFIITEGGLDALITVYFSQGGKWTHIEPQSIQPQFSSPGAIYANGKSEVDVTCARDLETGLEVDFKYPNQTVICSEYAENRCSYHKDEGLNRLVTATIKRPEGEDVSFVHCENDSFISFAIFWGHKQRRRSHTSSVRNKSSR